MRALWGRRWISCMAVVFATVGLLAASSSAGTAPHVPGPNSPIHRLTPGAHFPVGKTAVCKTGYSARVRNVPTSLKDAVYARYRITRVAYAYEVDHLVSLEIGGSNAITNLWPEHYYDPWGARTKDRLENKLHQLVCDGQLALASAQTQEATNWIKAYKRYVGATSPTGTTTPTTTSTSPPSTLSAGGYYASSYATARTIYCADDPAWKSLSATYLQHFATWAAAIAAHPGDHLHQPC